MTNFRDNKENDNTFHQDAVNSWNEYQETGLHATGDEVIKWLNTWGTDDTQDIPECHQ